ncbi:hypothetical protein MHU86_24465 [Fragilaria crotonensis]|nr:hypothetical protein MHU86_24465 [Fragilaria crotonensis]
MRRTPPTLCLVTVLLIISSVNGFHFTVLKPSECSSALFSEPRQPRRNLKKRRSRRQKTDQLDEDGIQWEAAELRPLISSAAIEAGEDYWIDEKDLEKSQARDQAIKNRKALEGEISKEKLWDETLAPYRQNWIGVISVFIVMLVTMVTKFPELLETPTPGFPDL